MIKVLTKLRDQLTAAERKSAAVLFAFVLVGVFLETLGVGLVVPVIALLLQSDLGAIPVIGHWLVSEGWTQRQLVVVAMLSLIAVYFLKNLFLAFLAGRQARFSFGVQERLSQSMFATYLGQPYTFHLQRNSSELIYNISSGVGNLTSALSSALMLLTELLVIVSVIVLLLFVEPVGAIVTVFVFGGSAWGFNRMTRQQVSRWGEERQVHDSKSVQHLQQGFGGAKDVKLLGREGEFLSQYQEHNSRSIRISQRLTTLQSYPRLMLEMLAVCGLALLVFSMVLQQSDMSMVVPTVGLFAAAAFRLMPSVNRILNAAQTLRFTAPIVEILHREIQLTPPPVSVTQAAPFSLRNELTVSDLVYRYPGAERLALDGVSLSVKRGQSIGLIGASGSGKSTLVDVLLGLLRPCQGEVAADGRDIHTCLRAWQDQIGYVPQAIYLTDDTLRRNVAFGLSDDEVDDAAVRRAIKAAQLDVFINTLPEGLNTVVGERGVRLSGGQRQRIGIARALYHDPEVLVLDEATSALDTSTELGVMDAVSALHGSKTVIIVAHRLSTVENCDQLVKLEGGKIIASGPPSTVLIEQALSH